jgi:methylated-DNA-[protein]-cysteine S-methyltransferase
MSNTLQLIVDRINTPIGEMMIVADHNGNVRAVDWADYEPRMLRMLRLHYGTNGFTLEPGNNPHGFTDSINRYFAGDFAALDTLPVETAGTPFQRAVWRALRDIPCGTTVTYAELAQQIGNPTAVRAVGLANGSNPIGVVVPCHRVIGANGSLTGYGGGIDRKRWLLDHESKSLVLSTILVSDKAGVGRSQAQREIPLT